MFLLYRIMYRNRYKLGLTQYDLPLTKDGEYQKWISLATLKDSDPKLSCRSARIKVFKKETKYYFLNLSDTISSFVP